MYDLCKEKKYRTLADCLRPVDQVQVDVADVEALQARLKGFSHGIVLLAPTYSKWSWLYCPLATFENDTREF